MQQKRHKKQTRKSIPTPQATPELMIANVPVVIRILHGEQVIDEYEEVIDLGFTPKTSEGRENIAKVNYLRVEKDLSTDDAIFTLASEDVRDFAEQIISMLVASKSLEPTGQQALHFHVERNGDITYKAV